MSNICNHEFKNLWYEHDEYGCTTSFVYLNKSTHDYARLAYCTKCGQVFVKEIAEESRKENE